MLVTAGLKHRVFDSSNNILLVIVGCASLGAAILLAVKFASVLREIGITNKPEPGTKLYSW